VGEITRSGVYTAVFSNMISLSLPALISVLRDREHVKTYLLRRALFKADVGHRDKGGCDSKPTIRNGAVVQKDILMLYPVTSG
jgi:hypothetical protein